MTVEELIKRVEERRRNAPPWVKFKRWCFGKFLELDTCIRKIIFKKDLN